MLSSSKKIYVLVALVVLLTFVVFLGRQNSDEGLNDFLVKQKKFLEKNNLTQTKIESSLLFIEAEIQPNQGLFEVLINTKKISTQTALSLTNILRFNFDLKKIKPFQKIKIHLTSKNEFVFFQYQENPTLTHYIKKNSLGKLEYNFVQSPLTKNLRLIQGSLSQSTSLNDALLKDNIDLSIISSVNSVVASKLNTRRDLRPEDQYDILVEDYSHQGTRIYSIVLFIEYQGKRTKNHKFYRFQDKSKESSFNSFYDRSGKSYSTDGLRIPVDRYRISSHFGTRIHPITGKKTMHNGVDYASPFKSNVYAVANGVVISSKYDPLAGNYIAIKHRDKTQSYYLHLHKRFVKKGDRIKVGQVIGFVGNSGRSTGVHLHFGFKNNRNRWINPLKKRLIAAPKLKGARLNLFQKQVNFIDQQFTLLESSTTSMLEKNLSLE